MGRTKADLARGGTGHRGDGRCEKCHFGERDSGSRTLMSWKVCEMTVVRKSGNWASNLAISLKS